MSEPEEQKGTDKTLQMPDNELAEVRDNDIMRRMMIEELKEKIKNKISSDEQSVLKALKILMNIDESENL